MKPSAKTASYLLLKKKVDQMIKNEKKTQKPAPAKFTVGRKPLSVGSARFRTNDGSITPLIIVFCGSVRLCGRRASGDQLNVFIQATHVHTAKKEDDQTRSPRNPW